MFKKWFSRTISILIILAFFSGCTTMMTVNAVDQMGLPIDNATVLVDSENIGQTPDASVRVSNFVGGNTTIRVIAEGFHPRTTEANREFKVGPFIGGLFIWPVLLWVWGPRSVKNVMLTPVE